MMIAGSNAYTNNLSSNRSMKLNKNHSTECEIIAREFWNATNVEVQMGDEYEFHAEGEWCDLTIRATAGGYATEDAPWYSRWFLSLFEKRRRLPAENWFVLVGAIGKQAESAFVIGAGRQSWKATAAGELMCFANDVPGAYGNNFGSVTLTIKRLT